MHACVSHNVGGMAAYIAEEEEEEEEEVLSYNCIEESSPTDTNLSPDSL
jgi:hypothetical protein